MSCRIICHPCLLYLYSLDFNLTFLFLLFTCLSYTYLFLFYFFYFQLCYLSESVVLATSISSFKRRLSSFVINVVSDHFSVN